MAAKRARCDGFANEGEHFVESFTDAEVDNLRISAIKAVVYPQMLIEEFPMSPFAKKTILTARAAVASVVQGRDPRVLAIVGPCSIHDPEAAVEYAKKLKVMADAVSEHVLVIMRVYFEKPRTTVGWKGLLNDPHMDETFDVNQGMKTGRRLLQQITDLGLPIACEFLDVLIPQYICDLVSWACIGARTTESQLHRQLGSALSMPVAFKNSTSGDIQIAADALKSANCAHSFLSITKHGTAAIVVSQGNCDAHVTLRGGKDGPNYKKESIKATTDILIKSKVNPRVVVDCSHGNSQKNYENQKIVLRDLCEQLKGGEKNIIGIMLESNIHAGSQSVPNPKSIAPVDMSKARRNSWGIRTSAFEKLKYGTSVTDACIDLADTETLLKELFEAAKIRKSL